MRHRERRARADEARGVDDGAPEIAVTRLRDTLGSLREGVQILSPDWRYLFVNDAVARHGRKSSAQAQLELRTLAAEGRYVRDVY